MDTKQEYITLAEFHRRYKMIGDKHAVVGFTFQQVFDLLTAQKEQDINIIKSMKFPISESTTSFGKMMNRAGTITNNLLDEIADKIK